MSDTDIVTSCIKILRKKPSFKHELIDYLNDINSKRYVYGSTEIDLKELRRLFIKTKLPKGLIVIDEGVRKMINKDVAKRFDFNRAITESFLELTLDMEYGN